MGAYHELFHWRRHPVQGGVCPSGFDGSTDPQDLHPSNHRPVRVGHPVTSGYQARCRPCPSPEGMEVFASPRRL